MKKCRCNKCQMHIQIQKITYWKRCKWTRIVVTINKPNWKMKRVFVRMWRQIHIHSPLFIRKFYELHRLREIFTSIHRRLIKRCKLLQSTQKQKSYCKYIYSFTSNNENINFNSNLFCGCMRKCILLCHT